MGRWTGYVVNKAYPCWFRCSSPICLVKRHTFHEWHLKKWKPSISPVTKSHTIQKPSINKQQTCENKAAFVQIATESSVCLKQKRQTQVYVDVRQTFELLCFVFFRLSHGHCDKMLTTLMCCVYINIYIHTYSYGPAKLKPSKIFFWSWNTKILLHDLSSEKGYPYP